MESFKDDLNVKNLLQVIREIKILIKLIFSQDQKQLFNFIVQSSITEKNGTFIENSKFSSNSKQKESVYQSYVNLMNSDNAATTEGIDTRLIDIFEDVMLNNFQK